MIPTTIIVHHTASSRDKTTLQDVDNWHKARDFTLSSLGFYVGYHFLITADGVVNQTRKVNEIGCHCIPNEGKVGICLTGNFDLEYPSPKQLVSLEITLNKIKKDYLLNDTNIFGHQEKSNTACPGKNLMSWIKAYRQISFLQRQIEAIKKLIESLIKGRSGG